jgi:PAS domain S-box-containing protein
MATASLSPLTQTFSEGTENTSKNGSHDADINTRLDEALTRARQFEERLDMLLKTSGDGLWDWNLRTDELYVSERWFQIVGGDIRARVGNVSSLWLSIIHAEDLDHVMRALYAHLSGDTARFEVEYRVICLGGDSRWVHSRGIAQRDERGQPQRMVGSHRDIGERKRSEERIRESQEIIRRNEERFRDMIEYGSDLITLVDSDGLITYQSPSVQRTLGYAVEELIGLNVTDLMHPDDRLPLVERIRQHAADATVASFTEQARVRTKDGNYRWVEVIGALRQSQVGVQLVLNSRDITDRVEATLLLEREVAKRTRELQTLLTINRTVSSTLDLSSLLETILDTAGAVVEYDVVKLFELDDSARKLRLLKHRGHHTQEELKAFASWDLNAFDLQVINSRKPTIIRDTEAEYAKAGDVRAISNRGGAISRIRSWMCLPLIVRDRVLGVMTFDNSQAGYYTEQMANIAMAFASQAAAAIENARLYSAEQMRLKVAEAMREQVRLLNASVSRDDVFKNVLQQVAGAMQADGAAIYELDGRTQLLENRDSHGLASIGGTALVSQLGNWQIGRAVSDRQVRAVDVATLASAPGDLAPEHAALVKQLADKGRFNWVVTIPLISDKEVYGGLILCYRDKRRRNDEDMSLAATIGYQSALGIENARLREEAAKSAIANERYRLARELHDSVSQALYGISLGARTARQIAAAESPRATDAIEYVLSLAEGGLAEMRALILELRPESLTTEGLVVVLQKQMAALSARHKFALTTRFCDEPATLPIQHKEALYRITMEATQNIIKHAQARNVSIDMAIEADAGGRKHVIVVLSDDGQGFDAKKHFAGHMGLVNMRERAEAAGGVFTINSEPGTGTQIRVSIPLPVE